MQNTRLCSKKCIVNFNFLLSYQVFASFSLFNIFIKSSHFISHLFILSVCLSVCLSSYLMTMFLPSLCPHPVLIDSSPFYQRRRLHFQSNLPLKEILSLGVSVTQMFGGTRGRDDIDTILANVKVVIGYPRTSPSLVSNRFGIGYLMSSLLLSRGHWYHMAKFVSGTRGYRSPIPTLISYYIFTSTSIDHQISHA